jgi:hypothetical protein
MALSTYTIADPASDPIAQTAIDSAVASAPTDRPSTFTPSGGYTAYTSSQDYGVSTTPTKRPMCFENVPVTVSIDPGLAVSG